MKILRKLVIGVVVLAVVLAAVAFLLPREVKVTRSTVIAAPPETVFAIVNSYKRFNEWSPWFARDPAMPITLTGPEEGVGARMSWSSKDLGDGTQEIVESVPYERVRIALDFGSNGNGMAAFTVVPEGSGTHVTWDFETDLGNNPVARYFGLMFDRWVGADYEQGLARLKVLAETPS